MSFKDQIAQRIQEKYDSPKTEQDTNFLDSDTAAEISRYSKFFGVENIRSHPACLDLRLPNGKYTALPYSYIAEIDFDTSEGITIIMADKKIVITGRNLLMLYNYLVSFRVKYIQANIGTDLRDDKELFVKDITFEDV